MRKIFMMIGVSLLLIFGCASCTKWVWENREECPCILTLDFSHIPQEVNTLHLWFFGSDDKVLYKDTLRSEAFKEDYRMNIKRDQIRCFAWGNIGQATVLRDDSSLNTSLVKRNNESSDSLYFSRQEIDTDGEEKRDTLQVNKEFIQVDVLVKGGLKKGESARLEIYSPTAGLSVDRRFVSGMGNILSTPISQSLTEINFRYRLHRQGDLSSLTMALIVTHNSIPVMLEHFPFGKWLSDHGYNMSAASLSDIYIEFDTSTSLITVRAEDWVITIPASNIEF